MIRVCVCVCVCQRVRGVYRHGPQSTCVCVLLGCTGFGNALILDVCDTHQSPHASREAKVSAYLPAGQSLQVVLPEFVAVRPAAHTSHGVVRFRSAENVFSAQGSHEFWPVRFWYCPGMHDVHLALPSESDDWPAKHSEQFHDSDAALTFPTLHL